MPDVFRPDVDPFANVVAAPACPHYITRAEYTDGQTRCVGCIVAKVIRSPRPSHKTPHSGPHGRVTGTRTSRRGAIRAAGRATP